jgi:pyrroline-5-carboxylate reductase
MIRYVLQGMKDSVIKKHLFISIAAGVTIESLISELPGGTRVVRVMPNICATVGEAASAICPGDTATKSDVEIACKIFNVVGRTVVVAEHLMDAVTGLSGSGPAFVFMIIEALADGGVHQGLDRATAQKLAAQTVLGAAMMVLETGQHPGELKDMVTSPGGTTIRGIEALEKNNVRSAIMSAVIAASQRSKELGK